MSSGASLVSVLVNCYNSEKFLKEALDSIYSQSYQHFEIILVDNCSADATKEIAQSYDKRLVYVKIPQTIPLYAARNYGLKHVRGDYLCFLDSDDIWLKNKLEKHLHLMKEKNVDFVYSGYQSFLNSPQGFRGFLSALYLKILARIQSPLCSGIVDRIKFIKNYNVNLQTVMIKTSCIKNTLFDDRLNLMGDLDFFYKILWGERAMVYYDSAVSALTRVHHTQLSRKSSQDWFQESKQVAESFNNMLSPAELKYFTYYFTNFYYTQVLFDEGQRLKANVLKMKYLCSGIRYWPHFIKSVLFRSF